MLLHIVEGLIPAGHGQTDDVPGPGPVCCRAALAQEAAPLLLDVLRKKAGKRDPRVHYEESSA